MVFVDLVHGTVQDENLISEIDRLLRVKMTAIESATSSRWHVIHDFERCT
jgi:hypothetical protein